MTAIPNRTAPRWAGRIDRLNDLTGRAMTVALLAMLPAQLAAIMARHVFSLSLPWLGEAVWYLNAASFMLAIGWVMGRDAHVRVDLFYATWPAARRARVDLFAGACLALPFAVLLLILSLDFTAAAWQVREGSAQMHGLPALFLLKAVIPLAALLIALASLAQAARAAAVLRWGAEDPG